MKKTIAFTIIMVLFTWMSSGNSDIYIGVTGGLNHSNFIPEEDNPFDVDPEEFNFQTVYGFGGVLEVPVVSFLSLRIQPMFLQRYSSYEPLEEDAAYRYKVSYLELPVLAKATIGNTIKPYILAGASVGFVVDANFDVEMNGLTGEGDARQLAEDFNLSMVFGAGFSYDTGKFILFAEGLYSHGLQNINKGGTIYIDMDGFIISEDVDPLEMKTKDFQIMVGLLIPLGKKAE